MVLVPVVVGWSLLALGILIGSALLIMIRFARLRRRVRIRRDHRRNLKALKHQNGVPIEQLGQDLRRLRELIAADDHPSATQHAALRLAYDAVLSDTCAMLGVQHELDRPTAGLERDIERLRLEALVEDRGIVLNKGYRPNWRADH